MLNRKDKEDATEEVVVEDKEEAKDKAEETKASRATILEDEVVEVEEVEDLNRMWIATTAGSMDTMRVSVGPRRKHKAMRIMHKPKREEMTQSC